MQTTIKSVFALGHTQNQNGTIYPPQNEATTASRLFIVSAGQGLEEHTHIISDIVSRTFSKILSASEKLQNTRLGQVLVNDTLRQAEREVQKYLNQYPRLTGVYGVVALAHFNFDGSITLAWVGNCRVYHLRNGKILYQTEDHVANMILQDKVVIQPRGINGAEPAWASVSTLTNLQPNDLLLLCTPDLIAATGDTGLTAILATNPDAQALYQTLETKVHNASQATNNASFFIIQIENSLSSTNKSNLQQGDSNLSSYADLLSTTGDTKGMRMGSDALIKAGIVLTAFMVLATSSFFLYRYFNNQPERLINELISEAQSLAVEGNYTQAISDLEKALSINTTDTEAQNTAHFLMQKMRQAIIISQGDSLFDAGEFFDAKNSYELAYNIDTDNADVSNKVTQIKKLIDNEKRTRLKKADSLFIVRDYSGARNALFEAYFYDQGNKRILDKINECNTKLRQDTLSSADAIKKASIYTRSLKDTLK